MTDPLCPTCEGVIPAAWTGRPRTYCSTECRRGMARRRRELADLEAQLVETRYLAAVHFGHVTERHAQGVERLVEAARARIPEELR